MKEYVFVMKLSTNNKNWEKHLNSMLELLSKVIDGNISIFELNEEGVEKAKALLK